ncbi:metal-sensing transcriptional repressor [Faecalicatena sp. AGMB00832]|uniref:Metal-sensing transcriptional repressor n=1 Tax=Faecalicatena faecalis TaxID=2726362 RepID=A0ABS6DB11_9FIRM|nr:metal-sensing transcriptional repressor [Faecalicatena faecalis]MBU3878648.1 metal-sensing transcriptional repressor [Faecalicatena faecalis]
MKINTEIHEHQHEHEEHSHAGADHVYTHDTGHSHDHAHTYDAAHPHDHAHTHGHKHVHSAAEKKAVINRLSKAIGHLEAVKRMVEKDEDCSEVLIQLAAVRSAINNTGKVVLKNHMNHCIVEAVEENDEEAIKLLNQAIDKFIK